MASVTATAPTCQTARNRKPRPKPARSIRWLTAPLTWDRRFAAVRIAVGKRSADYYVQEFAAPDGRGFELQKNTLDGPDAEIVRYHVYLHANGQDRQCDCTGALHHGHCKHADGMAALLTHGG